MRDPSKKYSDADFMAQVDLAAWDMATACGSCHVGGGLVETTRDGTRLTKLAPGTADNRDVFTNYVAETWDPATGQPQHEIATAPWAYPYPVPLDSDGDGTPDTDYKTMFGTDFMMPNVREMDCLFCHMEGYNNIVSSVAAQMGALNAAPSLGAGFMNMMTQSYMVGTGVLDGGAPVPGMGTPLFLSGATIAKIKDNPPTDNCRLCHSPTSMRSMTDMFDQFLAAAPMSFKPTLADGSPNPMAGPTGLAMPAYDVNAPFMPPTATTELVAAAMDGAIDDPMGPGPFAGVFPSAMGPTLFNDLVEDWEIGGRNPGGSGPMYYDGPLKDADGNVIYMKYNVAGDPAQGFDMAGTIDPEDPAVVRNAYGLALPMNDMNALKKATIAFPRADFFKRGDIWDGVHQEVHYSLECAGCHMDTGYLAADFDPADPDNHGKSLCDPGRGYQRLGGVRSGSPTGDGSTVALDSRNTVKKCEHCHLTGANADGVAITTFGAPNPRAAHAAAGLTANIVTARALDDTGTEVDVVGSHLDVVDCTVCHTYKESMAVRALDSTSGNRYPTMIGLATEMPDGAGGTMPMPGLMAMFSENTAWTPLRGWNVNGNKLNRDGSINTEWRRKLFNFNVITAVLWNNEDPTFDANGDGAAYNTTDAYWDPWIQRDLKAGMTFGASGLAPIPVGFGPMMWDPDGTPGSGDESPNYFAGAYNPDGTFSGGWNYVGLYGGNVIFTTPEEISTYKNFRTQMDAMAGGSKPWTDTKLVYSADPFQVTHNTVATSRFVLGKNCSDCHAAGSDFFAGGYDVTGTGIKADVGGNFMMLPVENLEVVAAVGDLQTEGPFFSRGGSMESVHFMEYGSWDGTTFTLTGNFADGYVSTRAMERADVLYPDPSFSRTARDGTVYTTPASWVAYLTNQEAGKDIGRAAFGLDSAPVADIESVGSVTGLTSGQTVTVFNGDELTLAANSAGTAGSFSYEWTCNDALDTDGDGQVDHPQLSGASVSKAFGRTGVWMLTLAVYDEEGQRASDYVKVRVLPKTASTVISVTALGGNSAQLDLDFSQLVSDAVDYDAVYLVWGDGAKESLPVAAAALGRTHGYDLAGTYEVTAFIYNGEDLVEAVQQTVTVN